MNAAVRILIADDDALLRGQVRKFLTGQHYIVEAARDGEEALDKLFGASFDAVILDIMMPKSDGLTVLQKARKAGCKTPVLLITARSDVRQRLKALDLCADDCLAKPFSLAELLARVRALLERSETCWNKETVLKIKDLMLDKTSRRVTKDGKPVELTAREFAVLEFLLNNKNRVVANSSLVKYVWGDDFDPFATSCLMDVHIKNLRQKIGDSESGDLIRTIRGVGYIIGEAAR